jgi:hypothetical protein
MGYESRPILEQHTIAVKEIFDIINTPLEWANTFKLNGQPRGPVPAPSSLPTPTEPTDQPQHTLAKPALVHLLPEG